MVFVVVINVVNVKKAGQETIVHVQQKLIVVLLIILFAIIRVYVNVVDVNVTKILVILDRHVKIVQHVNIDVLLRKIVFFVRYLIVVH